MKVDKIYRLESRIDWQDDLTLNNQFYTSKEEALQQLADFKEEIYPSGFAMKKPQRNNGMT